MNTTACMLLHHELECIIWMPHALLVSAIFTVITIYVCLHKTHLIADVSTNAAATLIILYYGKTTLQLHYFIYSKNL